MSLEDHIETIAYGEKLPRAAIGAALADPQTVPRTVDIVERVTEGAAVTEEEEEALCILLHICGELRATAVFRPLLRLLAGDRDLLEVLIGDSLTETMPKILIAIFDGTQQPLLDLMNDAGADDFARHAAFSAWSYFAAKDVWPRAESESYLRQAYERLEPRRNSYVWASWLDAVTALGLDSLLPQAERIIEEQRFEPVGELDGIPPIWTRQDFLDHYRARVEGFDTDAWLRDCRLFPFEDALSEISHWHCYSVKYRKQQWRRQRQTQIHDMAVNLHRDVGRNDPCPCGSGKKYKKCCLGQAVAF